MSTFGGADCFMTSSDHVCLVQAALEQGHRRLRVWKTTQAALSSAQDVDRIAPEQAAVRPWDHATHALCSGIMKDIVEKALRRIDHRPELKMIERCGSTPMPAIETFSTLSPLLFGNM